MTTHIGREIWTIGSMENNGLEAFEIWCFGKTLKIPWTERVTNEEVPNETKEKRKKYRSDKTIELVSRHESLLRG